MEIAKRYDGATLWQGQDAEGRRAYAITDDRGTVAVEPVHLPYYSKRAAEADVKPRPRKVGKPRLVDRKASEGQPEIRARVSHELAEWVKAQGGAEYVRRLLEREREFPPSR